jgi:S-methylmethionine-dependent homocysteine/selenocysteine methylase
MGTELARRGVDTSGVAWSARALEQAPDIVAAIHREYADAGCTVHTANTFRTTHRALGSTWRRQLELAVRIARQSVSSSCRVAGSLAPLEDCYQPERSPTDPYPEQLAIAEALASSGVDLLLCETFPSIAEGLSAVRAGVSTGLETWISWTPGFRGDLLDPAQVAVAAREAVALGASAVLVNCGPPDTTRSYVERLAGLGVPFGAYANAGPPQTGLGWEAASPEGPRRYAEWAAAWLAVGAGIVGGCCGTGPRHLRALRQRIDADVALPDPIIGKR